VHTPVEINLRLFCQTTTHKSHNRRLKLALANKAITEVGRFLSCRTDGLMNSEIRHVILTDLSSFYGQVSEKEMEKRRHLRRHRKIPIECTEVMCFGKLFPIRAAASRNININTNPIPNNPISNNPI